MDLGLALSSGILVSALVQIIKTYAGTNKLRTYVSLIVISLLIGGLYQWLTSAGYLELVLSGLVTSQAVYTFLIKQFEA